MSSEKGNPGKKVAVFEWESGKKRFRLLKAVSKTGDVSYYPEEDHYGSWEKTRAADVEALRKFGSIVENKNGH